MENLSILQTENIFQFADSCESREFCEKPVTARVKACESFANFCEFPANLPKNHHLLVKFATIRHCRDVNIRPFEVDWPTMVDALSIPKIRSQKDGKAIIFAEFNALYRAAVNVIGVTVLGFDFEANKSDGTVPPSAHDAADIIKLLGVEAVIYTTYSHERNAPRYRIIFPLSGTLPPASLKMSLEIVADAMPQISHWIDKTCKDAARLFYLPSCPPEKAALFEFHPIKGDILSVDTLQALIAVKKAKQETLRAAKPYQTTHYNATNKSGSGSVIARFNATFPLSDILQSHGYRQLGKRWLSPQSSSGVAGVHVFDDGKMFSHHGDLLGSQGTVLDAFEAFTLLEHGGDKTAATRSAAKLLEVR